MSLSDVLIEAYRVGVFEAVWRVLLEDGSYFADCPRDERGHCKGSGAQAAKKKGEPKKSAEKEPTMKKRATKQGVAGRSGKGGGKPPKEPPRQPPAGGDDEHRQRLKEIHEHMERSLQSSLLPDATKAEFGQTAKAIASTMTPTALKRFHHNLKGFQWYQTHGALTAGFKAKYPHEAHKIKGVLKGAFDPDGVLHLDGGGDLFGRPATLSEFYGHEMAHTLDGVSHEISESKDWKQAWGAEKVYLSNNGQKKPSEGWAEFGEMILGGTVTRKEMKQTMPKSLKVWEAHGL